MLKLQQNRSAFIYGAAAVSLAILGSGIAYYIIEDDKQVKRRKEGRKAERAALHLLQQIKVQAQTIQTNFEAVETDIENQASTDKEFKQKQYTLAHSNELLLQLMEKLDAIRPLTVIVGNGADDKEPTEFEKTLVSNIKSKKRNVIETIEGLFRRLDIANVKAKKEAVRREQEAKEKALETARIEKEEAEQKAIAEAEKERIRLENEQKLKEEQAKIAQEEALRRENEEKEQLAKAIIEKQAKDIQLEQDQVAAQEEAVLAALKEVEHDEK
ncbi:hypothetical protein INT47_004519 [Mucor saturninus]|uniref:BAG domain-containing protein n=1 Tax=Mucor saturninus TaxID=64648 RepID=A0A8H7RJQ5_9FUNG|nr:hypothetical protein INT47_004519 [Mucor saturninus]